MIFSPLKLRLKEVHLCSIRFTFSISIYHLNLSLRRTEYPAFDLAVTTNGV